MWLLGLLAGTLVCVSHFPGLRFPAIVRAGSVFQSRKRLSEPEASFRAGSVFQSRKRLSEPEASFRAGSVSDGFPSPNRVADAKFRKR